MNTINKVYQTVISVRFIILSAAVALHRPFSYADFQPRVYPFLSRKTQHRQER